jgi:dihydropyrimidinase
MFDLLIRNGSLVTPDGTFNSDLAVKEGKIAAVGAEGTLGAAKQVLDASGRLVFPGLVDPHVHIAHPFAKGVSMDDFYTATVSAAHGGTTTLIDFAIQWDKSLSLMECIRKRRDQADGLSVIDYGLHACPTLSTEETIQAAGDVIRSGAPSFKIYMIYRKQGRMVDDAVLYGLLQEVKKHGGMVGVHAENAAIAEFNEETFLRRGDRSPEHFPLVKPNLVEAECVNRALYLNRWAGSRLYIFHLSTTEGLDLLRTAQGGGESVYAETCPHYLALTDAVYKRPDGANFICSPPIRSQKDTEALWRGIADGSISVIGSDHCGFGREQKGTGGGDFSKTPNGLPGMEARLPVVYTEGVSKGRISVNRMVEVLSTNPARIFGLYPRKGSLLPGGDADLVIFDPHEEWPLGVDTLHSPVDWTPYEGMKVKGAVKTVVSRGKVIVQDREFRGAKGEGRYLQRKLVGQPQQIGLAGC